MGESSGRNHYGHGSLRTPPVPDHGRVCRTLPPLAMDTETTRRLAQAWVYGRWPADRPVRVDDLTETPVHLDDQPARLYQFRCTPEGLDGWTVLWVRPAGASGPSPCLLGLNFSGNHATLSHASVRLPRRRVMGPDHRLVRAADVPRGADAAAWDFAGCLREGWSVATACYCDIQEDAPEGEGVRAAIAASAGTADRTPLDRTGAVACWSWGLSRTLDALTALPGVDGRRVAVFGHSRLGKAALFAGVMDGRFAAVIPSQSGTGGVAPHVKTDPRAESVERITAVFPHWFAPRYAHSASDPSEIPVTPADLLRACAPRPVLMCNAEDDAWADPDGQFRMVQAAAEAWPDRGGLSRDASPVREGRVGLRLGYFLRHGGHGMTYAEWQAFRTFLRDNAV